MKRWLHKHKIKLIVGLLILATLMSTGIGIYLTEQEHREEQTHDGSRNSGIN